MEPNNMKDQLITVTDMNLAKARALLAELEWQFGDKIQTNSQLKMQYDLVQAELKKAIEQSEQEKSTAFIYRNEDEKKANEEKLIQTAIVMQQIEEQRQESMKNTVDDLIEKKELSSDQISVLISKFNITTDSREKIVIGTALLCNLEDKNPEEFAKIQAQLFNTIKQLTSQMEIKAREQGMTLPPQFHINRGSLSKQLPIIAGLLRNMGNNLQNDMALLTRFEDLLANSKLPQLNPDVVLRPLTPQETFSTRVNQFVFDESNTKNKILFLIQSNQLSANGNIFDPISQIRRLTMDAISQASKARHSPNTSDQELVLSTLARCLDLLIEQRSVYVNSNLTDSEKQKLQEKQIDPVLDQLNRLFGVKKDNLYEYREYIQQHYSNGLTLANKREEVLYKLELKRQEIFEDLGIKMHDLDNVFSTQDVLKYILQRDKLLEELHDIDKLMSSSHGNISRSFADPESTFERVPSRPFNEPKMEMGPTMPFGIKPPGQQE